MGFLYKRQEQNHDQEKDKAMNDWIRILVSLFGVVYLFYYLWNRWTRFDPNHQKDFPGR